MINRIYNPLARILYTDLDLKNIDAGGTQEPAPTPPTPITYLTQWKIAGSSEVHDNEIWSCGEYNPTDGKYHILVQPQGGSIVDIALNEPLRKVNDVADTIEFPSGTDGKALVTRPFSSVNWSNVRVVKGSSPVTYFVLYDSGIKIATNNILSAVYSTYAYNNSPANFGGLGVASHGTGAIIRIVNESMNDLTADQFKAANADVEVIYELATPTTELVDAPQIEEAESYSCVISQGAKAVEWSSFTPNYLAEAAVASVTVVSNISEYTKAIVDAEDKILYGLKTNGTEYTPDLTGDTITIDNITYDAQFIVDIVKATL